MKVFLYCLLVIIVFSCKKSEVDVAVQDTVRDEYSQWYTLKAPIDRQIVGVWGNYNKTILISTMFKLFRTTDQGRHWEQVHEQSIGVPGIIQYQDTLFTMSGLVTGSQNDMYQQQLAHADNYSINDGKTWHKYVARNTILSDLPKFDSPEKFLTNPIKAPNNVTYHINRVFLSGPNATSGVFETPGVIKSTGERIDLPQLHQLQSLYLDDQQRLYMVGSDAICSTEKSFTFCNSQAGRGVVYVSKSPLP